MDFGLSQKPNTTEGTTAILILQKNITEMKASNYDMQIKLILMHTNLLKFSFKECHWLKQILVISDCDSIPFCLFLLSTTLPSPSTIQIEKNIMSKIYQIITITWFSRNNIFHWFFCFHFKNYRVQEFRGAANWRTYTENCVYFRHLVHLYFHDKIKWLIPLLFFSISCNIFHSLWKHLVS